MFPQAYRLLAVAITLGLAPLTASAVSIGFNLVNGNSGDSIAATSLISTSTVGVVTQANWNNTIFVPAGDGNGSGTFTDGLDSTGATTSADLVATFIPGSKAYPSTAATYGWGGDELTFHSGAVNNDVRLTVTEIPYSMYDVIVYISAGLNGGNARADASLALALGASGTVDPTVYSYQAYTGTSYSQVTGTTLTSPTGGNYIRFTNNTASGFILDYNSLEGGGFANFDSMVSGIQIVAVPESTGAALGALGLAGGLLLRRRRR